MSGITEHHYARGFNAGRAFYERTREGAGANRPHSGYVYDTSEDDA